MLLVWGAEPSRSQELRRWAVAGRLHPRASGWLLRAHREGVVVAVRGRGQHAMHLRRGAGHPPHLVLRHRLHLES